MGGYAPARVRIRPAARGAPMPSSPPTPPPTASPLVHAKRAFGWNLGRMLPSPAESAALVAMGVSDPAVQRYAAWRRSLLVVAGVPTLAAFVLAAFDVFERDLGELTV